MANFATTPIQGSRTRPVILISMDGVGVAPPSPGNAVTGARTVYLDKYWPLYPHGMLEASGLYVGLPEGTDGNSEVGHMTMGAGKIILQELPRIDNAIKNETFFENPMLKKAFDHAKESDGNIHFMGLVGTGSVHASVQHLYALIEFAKKYKFDPDKVFIHAFMDGRDSPKDEGVTVIEEIEAKTIQKRMGRIVSMIGRAYAMDRNKNWSRTKLAYDLLTQGKGNVTKDWKTELKTQYDKGVSDEYIEPTLITSRRHKDPVTIKENDSIIFFNFRPDRAQQLTRAFEDLNFPGWKRDLIPNLFFVGFTDYKGGFPKNQAFPPEQITNPLGRVISDSGFIQLRIAESEKFPHVTYFFNGGNNEISKNERWIEVPSPKNVSTYDQSPTMSQDWVTKVLLEQLQTNRYDFILVNFSAPDMVAHTGMIAETKIAMQNCDENIGKIITATLAMDGAVVIASDHGNAEEMIDLQTGEPDTKHSVNQVPVMIVRKGLPPIELPVGSLADISPTVLGLLNVPIPPEMTGRDLLK